jgi:hypothetical protein
MVRDDGVPVRATTLEAQDHDHGRTLSPVIL